MRKLEEIIREYYIESLGASQTDERYPMFLQIAISGLRDLSNDLQQVVTDVVLPVNDNYTVNLPSDYIDYLLIGQLRGGQIHSLGLNNNMGPLPKDSCGNTIPFSTTEGNENSSYFLDFNSSHFSEDGQYVGRSFGLGGGGNSIGTYKVHKELGYIALNNFAGDEIILRYVSNISKVDGNFMVDEYMVEALKAWIFWKYVHRKRSYGLGEKETARTEYSREKRKAQIRVSRFNIPEFMNAYKSGFRSAPRM